MKKLLTLLLAIQGFFFLSSESVTILDFENNTGNIQYSPIIQNSQEAITMNVSIQSDMNLLAIPSVRIYKDQENLKNFSSLIETDYLIYGWEDLTPESLLSLNFGVYDSRIDKVIYQDSQVIDNILSSFDITDAMIIDILSSIHGSQVDFGSLVFTNSGFAADYRVIINGRELGTNMESLKNIMAGSYNLKISYVQDGETRYAYDETVQIGKDEEKVLLFSLPEPVIQEEKKEIQWVKKPEGMKDYPITGPIPASPQIQEEEPGIKYLALGGTAGVKNYREDEEDLDGIDISLMGLKTMYMLPRLTVDSDISFGYLTPHSEDLVYEEDMTILILNNTFKFNVIKPRKYIYWNIGPGFTYMSYMGSQIETEPDYGFHLGSSLGLLLMKGFIELEYRQTMFGNNAPFLTLSAGYLLDFASR